MEGAIMDLCGTLVSKRDPNLENSLRFSKVALVFIWMSLDVKKFLSFNEIVAIAYDLRFLDGEEDVTDEVRWMNQKIQSTLEIL